MSKNTDKLEANNLNTYTHEDLISGFRHQPYFERRTRECILIVDDCGLLLDINSAGLSILDIKKTQDIEHTNFYQRIDANYHTQFKQLISQKSSQKHAIQKTETETELKLSSLNNNERWLLIYGKYSIDTLPNHQAIALIGFDITQHKLIKQALDSSQQRLHTLNEALPHQIWTSSVDGMLSSVNKQTCDYRGIKEEVILNRGWETLLHPDDIKPTLKAWAYALKNKKTFSIDFRLKRHDGVYLWHFGQATPIYDASGNITQWFGSNTDISERKQFEDALQDSEKRLENVQAQAKLGSWYHDVTTQKIEWSNEMCRLFDMTPGAKTLSLAEITKRLHHDDQALFQAKHNEALNHGKNYNLDLRLPQKDGSICWIEARSESVCDDNGNITILRSTAQDITPRKIAEQEIITTRQLLDQSQKIAKVGGWELNLDTGILFWTAETYQLHDTNPEDFNPTVDAGLGYFLPDSRTTISQALELAINEGKGYDLELETLTTQGRKIDVRTTCTVTMKNGKPYKLTGIFQDISEQKAIQRELENSNRGLEKANAVLEHVAHYDALTELPNRTLLADRMQQAMFQNKRRGTSLAVAFLDLDGFKEVNDNYGHNTGDKLLLAIARRMKNALRLGDTLARIGGDEFVAVMTEMSNAQEYESLLQRLLSAVSHPVQIDNITIQVSASIGVTLYPQDGVNADQLLRHSDQAMYMAKQAGKNCYHVFDVAKDVAVKIQQREIESIKKALKNNEFVLYYQPKVNMKSGEVIGAEALIRWKHPDQGILPPAAFLPAIEEHPVSIAIGEWVMRTALYQMHSWWTQGLSIPVSINVGALQLQQCNFLERLETIIQQSPKSECGNLELEILETSALSDIAQISSVMKSCTKLGIHFALDDFGTGYSSLTYLKRLPAQLLKIDQSFVRDMLDDPDDLAIIEGIIGLAAAFKRNVIAEGVETIEHGEKLLSLGCPLAQGYGIARPMPADKIPLWSKTWEPDPAWRQSSFKNQPNN